MARTGLRVSNSIWLFATSLGMEIKRGTYLLYIPQVFRIHFLGLPFLFEELATSYPATSVTRLAPATYYNSPKMYAVKDEVKKSC